MFDDIVIPNAKGKCLASLGMTGVATGRVFVQV
jgi:hypothetical protein